MYTQVVSPEKKTGWLFFCGFRWMSLGLVTMLLAIGAELPVARHTIQGLLLLAALYTAALTVYGNFFPRLLGATALPLLADLFVCFALLYFSGGWASPFYLYSLSPAVVAAFISGGWRAFGVGTLSAAAYIAVVSAGSESLIKSLRLHGTDVLTSVFAYFLVAVFFSYAAKFFQELIDKNVELLKTKGSLANANKELASTNRQLVAVQSINAVVQSDLELPRVLQSVLNGVRYGLNYDRVVIGLVNDSDDKIDTWLVVGERLAQRQSSWSYLSVPIGPNALFNWIFGVDGPIMFHPDSSYAIDAALDACLGVDSFVIMPLTVKAKAIGVIIVDTGDTSKPFAPEDIMWFKALSTHSAIAINNAQLYGRAQELASITERNRIAMEIHDGLSQTLSGARLILNSCERLLASSNERVRLKLAYLDKMLARSYDEMRYAVYNLRLPFLTVDSLTAFFDQYIREFGELSGINAKFIVSGGEDRALLSEDVKLCLCRVLQEGLNNARKHASASRLTVFCTFQEEKVILKIADNGIGFKIDEAVELARAGKTFGIVAVENRVRQLGGGFLIESNPGEGATIRVSLPLPVSMEVKHDKSARR